MVQVPKLQKKTSIQVSPSVNYFLIIARYPALERRTQRLVLCQETKHQRSSRNPKLHISVKQRFLIYRVNCKVNKESEKKIMLLAAVSEA